MLEKFKVSKRKEIEYLLKLKRAGSFPAPYSGARPCFARALLNATPLGLIAEYKRASPSKGKICDELSVKEVAKIYTRAGASALSILTEEDWFDGKFEFLAQAREASPLPLLRKDFIFDAIQIDYTAASPASAILLIARLIPCEDKLRKFIELSESYGLEPVVEVFDGRDLELARKCQASIIQVNARDLDKLQVDCEACINLIRKFPPQNQELWIAASGITSGSQLCEAARAGYRGALVGTALMASGNPGKTLSELLEGARSC